MPAHQQGPKSNMVPNIQNGITGISHSHPGQPQIAYSPSGNTVMLATAQKYSSKSAISPALLRSSHAHATPSMLHPSNASNLEQPAAFMPYSPLAAPQHGRNGRTGGYAKEALNPPIKTTREVWADGLPPAEIPPDTQAPTSKRQRLQHDTKHAANLSNGTSNFSKYAHRSHSRAHIRMRNDLVESIDAKDAAVKESYDPATIARDVLINADKHPTEPTLNHHLEILIQKIPSVNITSDLATVRWDLLDPEGPRDTPQASPCSVASGRSWRAAVYTSVLQIASITAVSCSCSCFQFRASLISPSSSVSSSPLFASTLTSSPASDVYQAVRTDSTSNFNSDAGGTTCGRAIIQLKANTGADTDTINQTSIPFKVQLKTKTGFEYIEAKCAIAVPT